MSGVGVLGFAVGGVIVAGALGKLLALDPAVASARNERIRHLTHERRDRRTALEAAERCAANEQERLAQSFITWRVSAAEAAGALGRAGLPRDPGLVPPGGPGTGPAAAAWCRDVPPIIEDANRRAREALVGQAVQAIVYATGPTFSAADVLGPVPKNDGPHPSLMSEADATATLTRMLKTIDLRAAVADRAAVDVAAREVLTRRDPSARLAQVRMLIQQANDRADARHTDAVVAAQLLDAIEPYRSQHVAAPDELRIARAGLTRVISGAATLDDGLLDLIERLRSQVETRASAAAVADELAEVLDEIGYTVKTDTSVGEAVAGMLQVSKPDDPNHFVRMRVDAEQKRLMARVYRTGDQSPADDTEAEASWCGDLDRAIARLAASGVALTPVLLTAPGSAPTASASVSSSGESSSNAAKVRYRKLER
jgi:hypothetical protein